MKKQKKVIAIVVLLVGAALFAPRLFNTSENAGIASAQSVKVYKSPTCGCCANYATYLRREGYDVEVIETENMAAIKAEHSVPAHMESCHTSVFEDGKVVEGHIPVKGIEMMMDSDEHMIAMPGMPSGSPGMPGPKAVFKIHRVDAEGNTSLFTEL